jgi:5'-3' exonuclease
VFDGVPPAQKQQQLRARREVKDRALGRYEEALELGDFMQALKSSQMNIRITRQEKEDAKTLIRLAGLAAVDSPGEAEAMESILFQKGIVQGVVG